MTNTPPPLLPGGLTLHFGTLAQVAQTLARRGHAVTTHIGLSGPDTGESSDRTHTALALLSSKAGALGGDLARLGHLVEQFADDAVQTDRHVKERFDLLRLGGVS